MMILLTLFKHTLLIQAFRSHYCTGQSLRRSSLTFVDIHSISLTLDFYIFHNHIIQVFYTTFTLLLQLLHFSLVNVYTPTPHGFYIFDIQFHRFLTFCMFDISFNHRPYYDGFLHLHFYYYFTIH